jgi:META domain
MQSSNIRIGFGRAICAAVLLGASAMIALSHFAQAQEAFPFDDELLLDARPMKGSKRVPSLDIRAGGVGSIDLWCDSVQAQFVVAGDTVTILMGQKSGESCTPEREQADAELQAALEQVTNWRQEGDTLVLIGPQQLRFSRPLN